MMHEPTPQSQTETPAPTLAPPLPATPGVAEGQEAAAEPAGEIANCKSQISKPAELKFAKAPKPRRPLADAKVEAAPPVPEPVLADAKVEAAPPPVPEPVRVWEPVARAIRLPNGHRLVLSHVTQYCPGGDGAVLFYGLEGTRVAPLATYGFVGLTPEEKKSRQRELLARLDEVFGVLAEPGAK